MDGCSCSSWTSRRCAGLARRNETARAALGGSLPSAPVWRGGVALPLLQPGRNVVTVPPGESQPSSDLGPSVLSRPPFCMHPSRRLVSHNPPFPAEQPIFFVMALVPQVEIGGKGGRAGGGRCPPPRRLAIRGRRGGGTAPPRCRAPAAACAGGRCPVRSTAPTADQRPALTSPRVRRWARGVAPATSRRHHRHRRSARGRKEHVGLRSVSRPRRDARCTCANAHDLRSSSA